MAGRQAIGCGCGQMMKGCFINSSLIVSDVLTSVDIVSPNFVFVGAPTNFYANITTKYGTKVHFVKLGGRGTCQNHHCFCFLTVPVQYQLCLEI